MKQRLLSILLAVCMVMSLVPVTAMAANEATLQPKILFEDDFQDYEVGNFFDGTNKSAVAVEKGYAITKTSGSPVLNIVQDGETDNKYLSYTGSRAYVYTVTPSTAFTYSFDFIRNAESTGLFEIWLANNTEASGTTYRFRVHENGAVGLLDNSNTALNFWIQNDGTILTKGGYNDSRLLTNSPNNLILTPNVWYHIELTVDADTNTIGIKLYERDAKDPTVYDVSRTVTGKIGYARLNIDGQTSTNNINVGLDNLLCTVPNSAITAAPAQNGVVKVQTSAYASDRINVAAVPAPGYKVEQIFVNGKANEGNSFIMPPSAVTVSATFAPTKMYFSNDLNSFADGDFYNTTAATNAGFSFAGGAVTDCAIVADGSNKVLNFTDDRPYVMLSNPGEPYTLRFDFKRNAETSGLLALWLGYADGASTANTRFHLRSNGSFGMNAAGVGSTGANFMMRKSINGLSTVGQYNAASRTDADNILLASGVWYRVELVVDPTDDTVAITVYERDAEIPAIYSGSMVCADFGTTGNIRFDANVDDDSAKPNYSIDNIELALHTAQPYTVTAAQSANGTVRVSTDKAFSGDTVTATATPVAGYVVDTFTVNGTAISGNTFTMPEGNAEVTATFVAASGYVSKVDDFEGYEVGDFSPSIAADNGYSLVRDPSTATVDVAEANGNQYLSFTKSRPYLDLHTARDNYTLSFDFIRNAASSGLFELWVSEAYVPDTKTEDPDDTKPVWVRFRVHENGAVGFVNSNTSLNYWMTTSNTFSAGGYNASRTNAENLLLAADTWYHVELTVDPEAGTYGLKIYERDNASSVYAATKTIDGFGLRAPRFDAQNFADANSFVNVGIDNITYVMPDMVPYAVTIGQVTNGTVSVNKDSAFEGETITVTATADEGYELAAIKVDGEAIEGTSFQMPAKAVEVTAEFAVKACQHPAEKQTPVTGTPATCTQPGLTDGVQCVCGYWVVPQTTIDPAHTFGELVPAQTEVHKADELKAAVAAYYFCSACEKYFTEGKVETTLEALTSTAPTHTYTVTNSYKGADGHADACACGALNTVVEHTPNVDAATEETAKVCTECEYVIEPKLDHVHNLTHVPAEAADCTVDGNIEYWTCTCGKYFKDAEAKTEIALADTVLPAGHDIVPHEGKPAAPGIPGYAAYETCSRCDYTTYTEIPALEIEADDTVEVESFKESGKAPVSANGFFAGYYADADKTEAYTGNSGSAYVKFVSKNVLSVKYQYTAGTNAASDKTDLRLVTTVDDLNYREIGFKIYFGDRFAQVSSRTVFSSIVANDGGVAFTEQPTVFDAQSSYFMTYTITDVPAAEFGTAIKVVPYWVTLDGTTQEGVELNFAISDKF